MLFYSIIILILPLTAGSWMLRSALDKTMPSDGKNENARVTQAPVINIHLEKSEFPNQNNLSKHRLSHGREM